VKKNIKAEVLKDKIAKDADSSVLVKEIQFAR
jgi:hypothetical protein